jgi:hypothetical protein
VAVEGDATLPDLGLSVQDRDILVSEVGIVLHCAANVSFGAGLRSAVVSNLIGTKRVLQLCHQMKRIKVNHRRGLNIIQIWHTGKLNVRPENNFCYILVLNVLWSLEHKVFAVEALISY